MTQLSIRNIQKTYPNGQPVLKGINLEIESGEFLILVGGSGCGKSTLLNIIAGLEDATSGEICIDGKSINHLPPKDRDIAMVFQSYALYPSMTVRQNISFGLSIRKVAKAEQAKIVARVAALLQIEALLDRKPGQLSGGQRQRVAMGRALAREPKLFLFDEPLSNLDAKLRVEMRAEIKLLHQRLGRMTVYVTHDQIEAMTLGDKIAVMKDGVVQQFGRPRDLYDTPSNLFVAGFIGSPSMSFIKVQLREELGKTVFDLRSGNRTATQVAPERLRPYVGKTLLMGIRPENIGVISPERNAELDFAITTQEPTGPDTMLYGFINECKVTARIPPTLKAQHDTTMRLGFSLEKSLFFDPQTELRI